MLIKKRVRSANLQIRFFLVSMSCFIENCAFKKYSDTFTDDKKEMANALNIDQQSDRALKKYDPFKLDFSTSSSSSASN